MDTMVSVHCITVEYKLNSRDVIVFDEEDDF